MKDPIATNKKLGEIFSDITAGKLILRPSYQRNLVWSKKHRNAIVKTVLDCYPFPEIYIASGSLDFATGKSTMMLVDGQQRISSLYNYFIANEEFEYEAWLRPFNDLSQDEKTKFLEYVVVIRDLGSVSNDEIIEVFRRINSTNYNLKNIEINNAEYDGEFMNYCKELSEHQFFEQLRLFSNSDIKRMNDINYCAMLISTIIGGDFFDSDKDLEQFFEKYNDIFTEKSTINANLEFVFDFINKLELTIRINKKADIFTLIIELYDILINKKIALDIQTTSQKLSKFYEDVNNSTDTGETDASVYRICTLQSTNKRSNRARRAALIRKVILS